MRTILVAICGCAVIAVGSGFNAPAAPPPAELDRSPIDLALLPDGRRALTANQTADTVSLVDLDAGKVLAERPCGRRPVAVACSVDGRRAAVAASWAGTVVLFDVADDSLKPAGEITVGGYPQAAAFAPDGGRVCVAVGYSDEIVDIDWASRKVTRRRPAPHDPRGLALSADGGLLAVAGGRTGRVALWDESTQKQLWDRPYDDAFNLRGLTFTPDGSAVVAACAVRRDFPVSRNNIMEGWVIDNRLLRLDVKADAVPPVKQVALDERGRAVGDLCGTGFAPSPLPLSPQREGGASSRRRRIGNGRIAAPRRGFRALDRRRRGRRAAPGPDETRPTSAASRSAAGRRPSPSRRTAPRSPSPITSSTACKWWMRRTASW